MSSPARKYSGAATPPPPSLSFAPIQDPALSWRACGILWALCHWAWGRKSECWPSNAQVAAFVGCSPRTVQLALLELARAGYVTRRMEKTDRGWFRIITITERAPRPELRIVEAGGGGATDCATPGAAPCATPAQPLAPPLAQEPAHQTVRKPEERERELAAIVGPGEAPTPPAPDEPEWLRVDNLSPQDLDHWRAQARESGPLARIARRILDRWEKTTGPGSPTTDPRGPKFEGARPSAYNGIEMTEPGQDRFPATEHKTH